MRSMLLCTAAILLACVVYSHQEISMAMANEIQEEPGYNAQSNERVVRLVRSVQHLVEELKRQKRDDNERILINQGGRKPQQPNENFDEIDLFIPPSDKGLDG